MTLDVGCMNSKSKNQVIGTSKVCTSSNICMEAVFKTEYFGATICSKGLERRKEKNTSVVFDFSFLPRYSTTENGYYTDS